MAITDRTYTFQNYVNNGNTANYLVNSTGIANTGGTDAASIVGGIFNAAATIGMAAMADKQAASSVQNANLASLASMSQSAMTDITNAKSAISDYKTAKDDLTDLEARKSNMAQIEDLQKEVDSYNDVSEEQTKLIQQHKDLLASVPLINQAMNKARGYEQTIALCKSTAEMTIDTSGLSDKVSFTVSDSSKPGDAEAAVNNAYANNSDAMTNPQNELYATYQRDLGMAKTIDNQIRTRNQAKADMDAAQASLDSMSLPDCEGVNKPTAPITTEKISNYLTEVNTKISELAAQNVTSKGDSPTTISLASLSDKQGTLNQATKDKSATGNDSIDSKITAQQKVVDSKKSTAKTALAKLKTTLASLQPAYDQAMTLQREQKEMNTAKTSYDTAKTKNNKSRNFFQKMFGTGKSPNVKTAKSTYKAEKQEYEEAKGAMAQSYSDANPGQIAAIINTYNQVAGAIRDITKENPELASS